MLWRSAYYRLDKSDHLAWLMGDLDGFPIIPETRYWRMVNWLLTSSIYPGDYAYEVETLLGGGDRYGTDLRDLLMSPLERREKAKITYPLTIYRGDTKGNEGPKYCWSLDRRTAEWFALRKSDEPCLLRYVVEGPDEFALFLNRAESEVFLYDGFVDQAEEIPMENTTLFHL